MSWLAAIALVALLTWTLIPGGLAAIVWSGGYTCGHRLAKRVFKNPSGRNDDIEKT
jgi:hypothetical protein